MTIHVEEPKTKIPTHLGTGKTEEKKTGQPIPFPPPVNPPEEEEASTPEPPATIEAPIQDQIDRASSRDTRGDTIMINPGHYKLRNPLQAIGKNITFKCIKPGECTLEREGTILLVKGDKVTVLQMNFLYIGDHGVEPVVDIKDAKFTCIACKITGENYSAAIKAVGSDVVIRRSTIKGYNGQYALYLVIDELSQNISIDNIIIEGHSTAAIYLVNNTGYLLSWKEEGDIEEGKLIGQTRVEIRNNTYLLNKEKLIIEGDHLIIHALWKNFSTFYALLKGKG